MELFSDKIIYLIAGIGFILLIIGIKMGTKSKCSECSVDTKDGYLLANNRLIKLCRNHLIDRWKKDVQNSKYDMVFIEPDTLKYPYAYFYATINKLNEWQYTKEDQEKITSILNSINGKICEECRNTATNAYIRKENYTFPFLSQISGVPMYLCKKCVTDKVGGELRGAREVFSEGVSAPADDKGIYHCQEF